MSEIIIRTFEQDKEFALMVHQYAMSAPRKETREPIYCLTSPTVAEYFPDLKLSTLRRWAMDGKIGKMGTDGKYYVTLSEIEKKLFKK